MWHAGMGFRVVTCRDAVGRWAGPWGSHAVSKVRWPGVCGLGRMGLSSGGGGAQGKSSGCVTGLVILVCGQGLTGLVILVCGEGLTGSVIVVWW